MPFLSSRARGGFCREKIRRRPRFREHKPENCGTTSDFGNSVVLENGGQEGACLYGHQKQHVGAGRTFF